LLACTCVPNFFLAQFPNGFSWYRFCCWPPFPFSLTGHTILPLCCVVFCRCFVFFFCHTHPPPRPFLSNFFEWSARARLSFSRGPIFAVCFYFVPPLQPFFLAFGDVPVPPRPGLLPFSPFFFLFACAYRPVRCFFFLSIGALLEFFFF